MFFSLYTHITILHAIASLVIGTQLHISLTNNICATRKSDAGDRLTNARSLQHLSPMNLRPLKAFSRSTLRDAVMPERRSSHPGH